MNALYYLLVKDFSLEWRQKHALGGIFLYLVSTVFISYLVFGDFISVKVWIALFWIIMSFVSLNLVLKSFQDENTGRKLYLYTLVHPTLVIFSKVILNSFIMAILGAVGFILFNLFMGASSVSNVSFWFVMISGVISFASILTVISGIASQVKNNFTLITILGFPLLLPLLLIIVRESEHIINNPGFENLSPGIWVVFLLITISLVLSYILFPYLWKE